MGNRTYSDEALVDAAVEGRRSRRCCPRLDLLESGGRPLGLSGGSTNALLKGHAVRLGLDWSHFGISPAATNGAQTCRPDLANLPQAGSMMAATWMTLCGYDVSWPLEPARYDLVASRHGSLSRIQVKTCRRWHAGGWTVSLSTTSGGRRTYDPDDVDEFFVIDGDLEFYLIPIASLGGRHPITLSRYQDFRLEQVPVGTE